MCILCPLLERRLFAYVMFLPRECMRLYCIQSRMTVFHNRTNISSVLFANPDSCTHVKLLLQKVIDVIYFSLSINCTCKLLWTTIKPEDVSRGNHQRSLKFACLVVLTSLHIQHGIYSILLILLYYCLYFIVFFPLQNLYLPIFVLFVGLAQTRGAAIDAAAAEEASRALAAEGEFPFLVSLHKKDEDQKWSNCSGTLLSDQWVLTTAYCARHRPGPIFVKLGCANLNSLRIQHEKNWF